MLITYGLLALATSIDSMGIGLSYGVRKIQFTKLALLILFVIAFFSSFFAILIGKTIGQLLPNSITNLIGNFFLIIMGIFLWLQSDKQPDCYDSNHSSLIEAKEAFSLGIALSLDSFSIGIGAGMVEGCGLFYFPLFTALFQIVFLLVGSLLGKKIIRYFKLPSSIWNKLAAVLLIGMGILGCY